MKSWELRKRFLEFFEHKGHTIVPSSSLLPVDPSVLLTTAGMQQFKEYYLNPEKSPYGKNTASVQKSFRTSDINEVGDASHLTFFEMLGNFSFGGYFKEESIKLAKEFLDSIAIKIDYVTVFKGNRQVPKDEESIKIWEKLGFSGRISLEGKEENFWGPTGNEGPCGPTTEIYSNGIEIWNLVFNEYYCQKDKKLKKLKSPGVDTGMGLERLAMASQNKKTIFETDLFMPIIEKIENISSKEYEKNEKEFRVIADHIRGSVFLINDGILPSNVEQGYILRRVLRRLIRYGKILKMPKGFLVPLAQKVIEIYQDSYPFQKDIISVIKEEEEKFEETLEKGLKEFEKLVMEKKEIKGKDAFRLYETFGFPLEMTQEMARERGFELDEKEFKKALEKHQEISRVGAGSKFGGLGREANYEAIKLHSATHLLHQALRDVLGKNVRQMGSDITDSRLRFDFSYPKRMTEADIEKVEDIVNSKIKENLEVKKAEMSYKEALDSGALAFFKEKYPERVSVYSIEGPSVDSRQVFSKEICAGPHVNKTSELGKFKIIKEQSSGAGVRRIRAVLK